MTDRLDRLTETHKRNPSSKPNTRPFNPEKHTLPQSRESCEEDRKDDHQTLIKNKAKLTEEAAKRGHSKALYQITSDIVGKKRTVNGPARDKSGVLVTEPGAVNELRASHFERLLNRPPPDEPPNIPATPCLSLNISMEPPSATEIQTAAKRLKNGKSQGENHMSVEMIKVSVAVPIKFWTAFFATIWDKEKLPDDWKHGIIIRLLKKGDASVPGSWRGISLISVPGKLLHHVNLKKIQNELENHLRDEQYVFCSNCYCPDRKFVLLVLTEDSTTVISPREFF